VNNVDGSIEVRHHVFVQTGCRDIELAEVGPRMTICRFEIRGGTLGMDSRGEKEWVLANTCAPQGRRIICKTRDMTGLIFRSSLHITRLITGLRCRRTYITTMPDLYLAEQHMSPPIVARFRHPIH
jgi:hypothetical protein